MLKLQDHPFQSNYLGVSNIFKISLTLQPGTRKRKAEPPKQAWVPFSMREGAPGGRFWFWLWFWFLAGLFLTTSWVAMAAPVRFPGR